eukprot:CAMPEP_0119006354 /NCGR_PEP_ID=MMETSP1176-20130426/2249_1 /TAXON_ID=265551 /ORGANISM="Synedropsis recta cf, Strain CCMP1620" /LENGTH=393 /DNA_ID=CAMNT_0006958263 /DNA_START=215 /DNA_END=1396 /DNA_ORIENTATION=+
MGMTSVPPTTPPLPPSWTADHEGQHPKLHEMCVIDTQTMQRIIPNSVPILVDNECFSGQVMLLIRTPDVDNAATEAAPSLESAQQTSDYLSGRQRRFEFQFRVKFKKVPTGPIFLGCEVEQPVKIGRVTKGLTSVLLAMIRRINSGFHYSWGIDAKKTKQADIDRDEYEKTHLSFPVEASMDRIVITKPGETLPTMGQELPETDASVKRRRKQGAGSIEWNMEDTYTMCLWSAYVDWIQWRCMNVTGVRPFPLGLVLGTQPIYLSVYEIKNISNADYKKKRPPHYRSKLAVYSRMEFSHIAKTKGAISESSLGDHDTTDDPESSSSCLFEKRESQYEHMEEDKQLQQEDTASSTGSVSSNPDESVKGSDEETDAVAAADSSSPVNDDVIPKVE